MTQEAIQAQLDSLERVAAKINTPETARQFLLDAGIIKPPKKKREKPKP